MYTLFRNPFTTLQDIYLQRTNKLMTQASNQNSYN
uniref:Uncharacterized protein n=1 Tax=Anguilla anguilla TaxID=7936 RepID=A0A0E9XCZ1_ANGAN